jgi:hypothetical protein
LASAAAAVAIRGLIERSMLHPDVERQIRRIDLSDADATPPGHVAH